MKTPTEHQLRYFPLFFVLYEMASYLSNDAYLPAMPVIDQQLHTTEDMVRFGLTTWFLGGCFIQLLVGPLSDYVGRRKVLLWGGLVFVLSTLGCALAPNIHLLNFMRFIEGATIATMAVTGYATIHAMYDTKKAIHTIAFMNSISVLAPSFGPLFGALIVMYCPWETIFHVLALWAIIPLVFLYKDMPETADTDTATLKIGTVLGQYKRILLNGHMMIYVLASRMIFAAMIAWLSAGPFLLYDTFHLDSLHFGLVQMFVFGSYILGNRATKRLMETLTLEQVIAYGWALSLAGCAYCVAYAAFMPTNFYPILPGLMLLTLGAGLSMPIYSRLAIEQSEEPMGSKVAFTTFSMTLFGVIATLIINLFFTNTLMSLVLILSVLTVAGWGAHLMSKCLIKN